MIDDRHEETEDQPASDPRTQLAAVADRVLTVSDSIRYVAVAAGRDLVTRVASGRAHASGAESDLYEELLVNPTILDLATRRGELGCGGLDYVVVRYGNFSQLLVPVPGGHISVCVETTTSPIRLVAAIVDAGRAIGAAMHEPPAPPHADLRLAPKPFVWSAGAAVGTTRLLDALYGVAGEVRYVALRTPGRLVLSSRLADPLTADDRSDRYEELLVNPTLLAIATARGAIDCGGLRFIAVGYAAFFALVLPLGEGHATVSLPRSADPVALAPAFEAALAG